MTAPGFAVPVFTSVTHTSMPFWACLLTIERWVTFTTAYADAPSPEAARQ